MKTNLLTELQELATNVQIAKWIDLDSAYITRLCKKPLSEKNEKKLKELNSTEVIETDNFKKIIILEYKN